MFHRNCAPPGVRNLLPLTLLHAYLNAFEHFEAFRNYDIPILRFAAVQYFPGMHKGIDPVNFLIPCVDVENLRDVILVVRLHRRNEEIAVVGEAEAAQPLSDGLCRSRLHCRAFPVERELTMIMIVVKHQLKPSMCPSTTSILQCLRRFRQSRHPDDVSGNSHDHLSTGIDDDVLDIELEAFRRTIEFLVLGERVLGLGEQTGNFA